MKEETISKANNLLDRKKQVIREIDSVKILLNRLEKTTKRTFLGFMVDKTKKPFSIHINININIYNEDSSSFYVDDDYSEEILNLIKEKLESKLVKITQELDNLSCI